MFALFPCWVGCTMTLKEQPKPRKGYGPGVRKRYLAEYDDYLKIPVFFCLLSRFLFMNKEKTSSFSLFARVFLCLFIKQRFAHSRFIRTDPLSSQHRPNRALPLFYCRQRIERHVHCILSIVRSTYCLWQRYEKSERKQAYQFPS